ncbi:MAG: peptide-methionine (S)-S-oxide reductase MsrA [Boseongicola sp.]|nr:peptide-methionine (S)-S-oxide reductase MsrA [Boseongicola sp.]
MSFVNVAQRPMRIAVLLAGIALTWGTAAAAETKKAYFAGGCFWCVEADFESVRGVSEVISGYTGGSTSNPTYKQVTRGGTGHFEAVEIIYNSNTVSYESLLTAFFRSVDPTDAGGQFCDRGESYRTAIFVSNAEERKAAEAAKARSQRELGKKLVTPILVAGAFYKAEAYHQNYYRSKEIVITRRGPKSKANAYKFYRNACKRDQRVIELWGKKAPFAKKTS